MRCANAKSEADLNSKMKTVIVKSAYDSGAGGLTGIYGIFKPDDVQVVMTLSAFSTEGSDGGGRIAETKRRQDSREDW